ncbi:MAG: hypothetical protein HYV09_26010 [Deltaproteobacteria bacterium]|nr:hypothetical protein [Deltaproteobacteria bacterium]
MHRATRPPRRRVVSSVLAVVVGATSLPLAAAPTEQEQAIAKDLFDKGVKLNEEHKCDEKPLDEARCREARDAFKRAYELTGALGALRNLAYVEKGLGMIASAARSFRDLARKAPLDPKPERRAWADYARKEADELEPRVPRLTVKVVDDVPGLKITLDGTDLPRAAWNTSIDIDPGKHSVHAEAPGRLPFEGSATLAEKQNKAISVVLFADSKHPSDTQAAPSKTLPIVVTAVGAAAVGVGLGLGYASMKKRDDSCDANKLCDPQGLDDGRALATGSTIVTAVGAAALTVGIVWWALTPSAPKKDSDRGAHLSPWASRDGAGLAAFGRF